MVEVVGDVADGAGDLVEGAQGLGVEVGHEASVVFDAGVVDLFDEVGAGGGEFDAAYAAVVGVFVAADEAVGDEAVDDAGDGAEADAEVVGEVLS